VFRTKRLGFVGTGACRPLLNPQTVVGVAASAWEQVAGEVTGCSMMFLSNRIFLSHRRETLDDFRILLGLSGNRNLEIETIFARIGNLRFRDD
jgi:hypothetical protein